jgi:hypothetical protein
MTERAKEILIILSLIVVSGLLLAYGLNHDLPHLYNGDEGYLIFPALKMGIGDLDPISYVYAPFFKYILLLCYGVYFVIGFALGKFPSPEVFAIDFFRDPSAIYLISRAVSAAAGVGAVVATYLLGRELYQRRVGLAAAVFIMVSPLFVNYSHQAKSDVALTLLYVVSLYLISQVMRYQQLKHYVLAGLVTGAAMALKFTAVMLVFPFLYAHFSGSRPKELKKLVPGLALVAAGFFAANPFALIRFPETVRQVLFLRKLYTYSQGPLTQSFGFWTNSLSSSLGFFITVSALIGLVSLPLRRRSQDILLPMAVISFFLPVAFSFHKDIHWILPVFPLLALMAAVVLIECSRRFRSGEVLLAGLVILFSYQPFRLTTVVLSNFTRPDTRTLALGWVEKNIPAGTKVLMDRGRYESVFNAPLKNSRRNIERLLQRTRNIHEGYGGYVFEQEPTNEYPYLDRYYEYKLKALEPNAITYDIVPIFHGNIAEKGQPFVRDNLKTLPAYRKAGVKYVIVSSICYNTYKRHLAASKEVPAFVRKYHDFYESLDVEARLLRSFSRSDGGCKGPTIKIYRI